MLNSTSIGVHGLAQTVVYKVLMAHISILWKRWGGSSLPKDSPYKQDLSGANRCLLAYEDVSTLTGLRSVHSLFNDLVGIKRVSSPNVCFRHVQCLQIRSSGRDGVSRFGTRAHAG